VVLVVILFDTSLEKEQDLLGQVSRLRKREGQKYVNLYGKSDYKDCFRSQK
jgi:hypothetical protein